MNPLKILLWPLWYPSPGNDPYGGIFIQERARALSAYDEVVVVYIHANPSGKYKKLYEINNQLEAGIRTIRIRLHHFKLPPLNYILRSWFFTLTLNKLIGEGWRPDVIDVHSYFIAAPAIILGKLLKIGVVITEHDGSFELHRLSFIQRMLARFAMNRAALILPVSNSTRKAIKEYYKMGKRFHVIPNVVDTTIFTPSNSTKISENNSKVMITTGRIIEHKGIAYLIEALSLISVKRHDFYLDVIGDGPKKEDYEKMVKRLGLSDKIKFHGWKKPEEVALLMKKSDFFVLPSLHETFGTVYIEAMACGKPVIATNSGGSTDIVTKESGLLIPPENIQALKEAIEFMLNNLSNYSADKIVQYARENFSYEVVGRNLDKVYREAAGFKCSN